jgi:HSP20 family molecular chaperone IbpA
MPSVDIFEENDDIVVKAELPGIKKDGKTHIVIGKN